MPGSNESHVLLPANNMDEQMDQLSNGRIESKSGGPMQIGFGPNRESFETFLWEALPILGLLASTIFIAIVVYSAH